LRFNPVMKNCKKYKAILLLTGLFVYTSLRAQDAIHYATSTDIKLAAIFSKTEDSLAAQFRRQNLAWPPSSMYIRSFKYDKQLEVWVKADTSNAYHLFKTYKICMQSGTMGPKRMEGDYQVPEGFYHINELNPNSNYHLSLGINYPNASDRILSDAVKPGGAIYIHGRCVSTGCIAITDQPIEELYVLASITKNKGQDFIPVHIFPVRYSNKNSFDFLNNMIKDNLSLQDFNRNIRSVYDYFEAQRDLPLILVNRKGEYVIN
jgi:murein L,D-transpeptidase YafK